MGTRNPRHRLLLPPRCRCHLNHLHCFPLVRSRLPTISMPTLGRPSKSSLNISSQIGLHPRPRRHLYCNAFPDSIDRYLLLAQTLRSPLQAGSPRRKMAKLTKPHTHRFDIHCLINEISTSNLDKQASVRSPKYCRLDPGHSTRTVPQQFPLVSLETDHHPRAPHALFVNLYCQTDPPVGYPSRIRPRIQLPTDMVARLIFREDPQLIGIEIETANEKGRTGTHRDNTVGLREEAVGMGGVVDHIFTF